MKFDMKRPLTFKGGVAAALMFSRVNVAGMLELASSGDILSPEASALYASRYGRAVTKDGVSFEIHPEDITECISPAPALSAAMAFTQCRDFDKEVQSGERVPASAFEGVDYILRLKYPIKLTFTTGTDERAFEVEWLTFAPRKYSEVADFVRSYLSGKEDSILTFIRSFGMIVEKPAEYPLDRLTDSQVGLIDASDAERIAELVMPSFIEVPGL